MSHAHHGRKQLHVANNKMTNINFTLCFGAFTSLSAMSVSWLLIAKVLWLVICCAGLAYQITRLCKGYFAYDISTTVQIKFPNEFTP